MDSLKLVPYIVLVICIAAVVAGACAITIANFQGTVTTCYNSSYTFQSTINACNSSVVADTTTAPDFGRNFSGEYWALYQGQEANSDIAEQLGTVAIIGVMVIIIALVSGVFVYMKYFG